jgi:hypothetical protein
VQDRLSQQLLDQLKQVRYGDREKSKRPRKANRLPPGTAYTVSAVPAAEEPVAGPSSAVAEPSGDSGGRSRSGIQGGRGGGHRRESWCVRPNFYNTGNSSDVEESEESEESEDNEESEVTDAGSESSEDSMDSDGREAGENMMQNSEVELEDETENVVFEVGDFMAAVYEGDWLLAQVDIDQDHAATPM